MSASIPKAPKKLDVYQFGEQIGKGAKGVVFKGINIETAAIVAIKQISTENIGEEGEKAIQMEIGLLKRLKHPNIVKYVDARFTSTHLFIILEYVDSGCLHSIINKFGPFPESLVAIYIKQVLTGLDYLHSQGVVHRDIKGANILTTKEGTVKLADFGVATKLTKGEQANSVVGTPYWMAPEIIEMSGYISTACDIWSVGCTVIELLTGSPPYFDLNKWSALIKIVQDEHPPLPADISENCKDFLLKCFEKDAGSRIEAKDLLKHPWVRSQGHQALDIINDTHNQLPQEVTNTVRLHMDKTESLPLFPGKVNPAQVISKFPSEERSGEERKAEPRMSKKRSTKGDDQAADGQSKGKTWTNVTAQQENLPNLPLRSQFSKNSESNHLGNENIENSLYRLTHSTVEGRESLNKSQSLRGLNPQYHPEDMYQGNIDKRYMGHASNFASLQDGTSFVFGEHGDGFPQNASQVDKHVKPGVKPTRPQQEYKFGKELDSLVFRMTANTSDIGMLSTQDDFGSMHDYPGSQDGIHQNHLYQGGQDFLYGKEESPMRQYNAEGHENFQYLYPPGVNEIMQDLHRLEEIFLEYDISRSHFMRKYGLTVLIDILEQNEMTEVKEQALQVINTLALEDPRLQEEACLFGILPYIIKYAYAEYPKSLRIHAARFLGRLGESTGLPFQMLLASGGFKALVELLDIEYEENRDLVGFAVQMLSSIFDKNLIIPQHLCRILVRLDVSNRLMIAVSSLYTDANEGREPQEAQEFLLMALNLMENFVKCQDRNIREQLGQEKLLQELTYYLEKFQEFPQMLAKTARILLYLAIEPSVLARFEGIELISCVLKLITKEKSKSPGANEEILLVLLELLKMCQWNAQRQEEVVAKGGVEILVDLKQNSRNMIERNVVAILCQFVETSDYTRKALWDHGGPKLFLDLLDNDYYQPRILDVIALWLQLETEKLDDILIEPGVFNKFVHVFKSANKKTFLQIIPVYLILIERSDRFTSKLSKTPEFVQEIVERLGMEPNLPHEDKLNVNTRKRGPGSKGSREVEVYGRKNKREECSNPSPFLRKELLDILRHLCMRHENPRSLMNEHDLYPIILQILHLSQNDETVILTEIATLLLRIYSEGSAMSYRLETQTGAENIPY